MIYAILAVLAVIGVYDLWLVYKKQDTISHRIHLMFPRWLDWTIMVLILGVVWWYAGVEVFTYLLLGTLVGHFFWHEQ